MPRKSHGRNQMLALVLSSVGGWSHKLVMMLTGEVGELPLRDMLLKAGGSAWLLDCAAPSESWTAALLPDNLGAICSIFETRQQLAEADVNALHSALVCNDLYGQTYYGRVEYVNALYVGCVYANRVRRGPRAALLCHSSINIQLTNIIRQIGGESIQSD